MKIPCPCCGKSRNEEELLALEAVLGAKRANPWWSEPGWTVAAARTGSIRWACRTCLKSRKAVLASPWLQVFCDHPPLLAYAPMTTQCRSCAVDFVFSPGEQRHWYEQLKFLVQSKPVRCAKCRRSKRETARRQTELTRIMKTLDEGDPLALARAATALLAVGSRQKAALFLRRARNLARTPNEKADFIRQLESLVR